jgi:hypothetical protein
MLQKQAFTSFFFFFIAPTTFYVEGLLVRWHVAGGQFLNSGWSQTKLESRTPQAWVKSHCLVGLDCLLKMEE